MLTLIARPHGGALRAESPITHTPPGMRCIAVARATGQRCKAIRVRGHSCCRMHGGSVAVIKRYREELKAICAKPARRRRLGRLEWLLARLARAERNRPRAYDSSYESKHEAEAERLLREVSVRGATELCRRVHPAALAVRPYRPVDCLIASAQLALRWTETRHDIERVMLVQEFLSALALDQEERVRCEEMLAVALGPRRSTR